MADVRDERKEKKKSYHSEINTVWWLNCKWSKNTWINFPHQESDRKFIFYFVEKNTFGKFVVIQSPSCVRLFATPWTAAHQASLSSTISQSLQVHVHWDSDAIQPSHPVSSPSPPALNLSKHQGLFRWVGSLHQVAKVLTLQLQHLSFQWTFRVDFL